MNFPRQSFSEGGRPSRRQRAGGFTRIEVVLALIIFVLATGLLIVLLGRYQQRRRCDRFIADLRGFAAAFQSNTQQKSGVAVSAGEATLPAGTDDLLKGTHWFSGSPFGGNYGWVPADRASIPRRGGAIVLTAFAPSFPLTLSKPDLLYIDATLDDGNLASGRFRTGFNGWPVYLLGDKP